jgi:16S rRNA (guanine(527)-N(7))-methyltransferase RsmG
MSWPRLREIVEHEMRGLMVISPGLLDRLESHYSLMLHWNRTLNLTTVTDVEGAAVRHYCESLYLARVLTPGRVVDVGSGAGFPGLVAAMVRSECQFDLVESHQRKAVFLREVSREQANVRVLAKRAEVVSKDYDWTVSRAVRPADVVKLNLSLRVALLVGKEDSSELTSFKFEQLPWGDNRFLAVRGA